MGNFSRDTFDALKHYVGVRLQQGVPLVDADWNEAEDIRRHELRTFLRWFVGDGAPLGSDGFRIEPAGRATDFRIAAGRCIVAGWEVVNDRNEDPNGAAFYTTQRLYNNNALATEWGVERVPRLQPLGEDERERVDAVYLDVWEREIDASEDRDLVNTAIAIETAVRQKREWVVRVEEGSENPPSDVPSDHAYYPLATMTRVQGAALRFRDRRRTGLTLSSLCDAVTPHSGGVSVGGALTVTPGPAQLSLWGTSSGDEAGFSRVHGQQRLVLGAGATRNSFTVTAQGVGIGTTNPASAFQVVDRENIVLTAATEPPPSLPIPRVEIGTADGSGLATLRVHGQAVVETLNVRSAEKVGYISDYFLNHANDDVEQGDVVVLAQTPVQHYCATNNDVPIPEVDLAADSYDTRVCGVVTHVVDDNSLPHAAYGNASSVEASVAKRASDDGGGAIEHPLLSVAAESGPHLDSTHVGPNQLGSMVTLGAFSYCKVDADIAPIEVGDLLTTSETKGHAQKVTEPERAVGAIIGKALGSLTSGRGKIPVLVLLH